MFGIGDLKRKLHKLGYPDQPRAERLPAAKLAAHCDTELNHIEDVYKRQVDASGDVFVGDVSGNSGQVKEIMAVDGSIPASPTIKTLGSYSPLDPLGVAVDGMGNVFVLSLIHI